MNYFSSLTVSVNLNYLRMKTSDNRLGLVWLLPMSLQHLQSQRYWYRLVTTVGTHGDFIALPHWEIMHLATGPNKPLSHIILTLCDPVLVLSH